MSIGESLFYVGLGTLGLIPEEHGVRVFHEPVSDRSTYQFQIGPRTRFQQVQKLVFHIYNGPTGNWFMDLTETSLWATGFQQVHKPVSNRSDIYTCIGNWFVDLSESGLRIYQKLVHGPIRNRFLDLLETGLQATLTPCPLGTRVPDLT